MKSLACELNYIVKGAVYLEHRLNLAVMRHEEYLCGLSRVTFAFLTGKGGGTGTYSILVLVEVTLILFHFFR